MHGTKPKNEKRNQKLAGQKSKNLDSKTEEILLSPRSAQSVSDHSDDEKIISSARSDQKLILNDKPSKDSKVKSSRKLKAIETSDNTGISGTINQAFEPDNSQPIKEKKLLNKPPRRARKAREKAEIEQDTTIHKSDSNILAIIIHQTDKLRTDINIYNPTVRVHILDLDTDGQYVKKTKRDRNTLVYYEKENRKLDFISPISSTPYDFKKNRTIIPKWEELIVFNEEFSHFTKDHPNVLLMFELIDVRKHNELSVNYQTYTSQETNQDWQRIAWAFLKIRSFNNSLNIEKKLRLQLFYTQAKYKFNTIESMVPEIYNLYKYGPRVKYPASLHVTIKSIIQPKHFMPGVGSSDLLFAESVNAYQDGSDQSLLDLKNSQTNVKRDDTDLDGLDNFKGNKKQVIWSRINGLPCKVPNQLHLKLNTTKRGCYSVKFSNTGNFLACACNDDDTNYPILVYEITGDFCAKFNGHFGLVYEISWSKSDKYIVTASNDATARVFDIETKSKEPFKILPHPNFLYTAKFFPHSSDMVVTGGYDKVLRIWSIDNPKKKLQKYGELLQELYGHEGYINTTCFSNKADTFYSADSLGKIKVWNCYSESNKGWIFKEDILVAELKNEVINLIQLLPNQFRMLVQMKDNQLNVIDVRIKSIVQHFKGMFNLNQNLRSCISPCGTFLFNSGGDTNIYCWNINTGDQLETITLNYVKPARDIDFHPYDNYMVFCCNDSNAPVFIYKHNPEKIFSSYDSKSLEHDAIGFGKPKLEEQIDENELDIKLKNDINKLKDSQNNIWRMVNDKLDSVYPRGAKNNNDIWSKNNYPSSLTMTMVDSSNKPEFKYRGPKEVEDIVISLYDYKAQRGDELDLKIGDEILVLVRENENWWLGELINAKQEGYFPAAYVQEKSVAEGPRKNLLANNRISVRDTNSDFNRAIEPIPFSLMPQLSGSASSQKKFTTENPGFTNNPNSKKVDSMKASSLNVEPEVNTINEIPTKDMTNSVPRRKNHKRGTFGHVISGTQSTSSKN
ncbi:jouberin isoform X2 [Brachionus plicatilis]|uniref:Jouberin isoform X2 n=1 Tax=Brachionus plicatilis TaxID=10195 RepID=A0A3M7SY09_BRAPC|nr:jouberin isoform X2 [Brachionus plicatilis]